MVRHRAAKWYVPFLSMLLRAIHRRLFECSNSDSWLIFLTYEFIMPLVMPSWHIVSPLIGSCLARWKTNASSCSFFSEIWISISPL